MSTYIAIDLKSFYASVECIERGLDPLKANLVVADASRTSKTICLALSPNLKKYGLPGRCRLFEVEQKCKEIKYTTGQQIDYVIAPPRMALYLEYSTRIFQIYKKYISPEDIHVYSIDEVFIDVTSYLSLYKMDAITLCRTIIKDILFTTGITATAGIGTNLYLSKVAMDIVAKHTEADEYGVRIAQLDEIEYRKQLWNHTPLTDFWRFGRGISNRLQRNNLHTMGDIARESLTNIEWFYNEFGIDAEIIIDHAWGYEPCEMKHIKQYKPTTNSLTFGQVLSKGYTKEEEKIIVKEMIDTMVLDLVDKDLKTNNVSFGIGYEILSENSTYKGPVVLDHYGRKIPKMSHKSINIGVYTSSKQMISKLILETYEKIVNPRLKVRRVMLNANNVKPTKDTFEQLSIFSNVEENDKEQQLHQTLVNIQKKYGKSSIIKGTDLEEGATTLERNQQIGGHKA